MVLVYLLHSACLLGQAGTASGSSVLGALSRAFGSIVTALSGFVGTGGSRLVSGAGSGSSVLTACSDA